MKGGQRTDENTISNALLAKQKELNDLKDRAMDKDRELRVLENILVEKSEERNADIESLKGDLGDERQAWMTAEN